jgi:D-arabinose 1-dehydrogenase-like Zn-dependent alcohol dehydrogenase
MWIGLESLGESITGHKVEGVVEKLGSSVESLGNGMPDRDESVVGEDVGAGVAAISFHAVLCAN